MILRAGLNSKRHGTSFGSSSLEYYRAIHATLGFQAYSSTGDYRQIVTGVSERGSETAVRYWIQQRSSKKTQVKQKARMEFLSTRVRCDGIWWAPLANLYLVGDRINDYRRSRVLIVLVLRCTANRLGF